MPLKEDDHLGDVDEKLFVYQIPSSVPTMTSSEFNGFCKIDFTGISGRFPSFDAQEVPPFLVYHILSTP